MKGIVITTESEVSTVDYGEPLHQTVGATVGGYIEHVKPRRLMPPYCMIVNEDGQRIDLDVNPLGCYLYETDKHGVPIVGDIVIMKDDIRDGEPNIVGLEDAEIDKLTQQIHKVLESLTPRAAT